MNSEIVSEIGSELKMNNEIISLRCFMKKNWLIAIMFA